MAFAFALLGVGRDHDLEEELVDARHRRDDQLARLDRHRRLQRRLRDLLPVVGRAEVVAKIDEALYVIINAI